jgi:capsular exopolysaccharide synthesis family protein
MSQIDPLNDSGELSGSAGSHNTNGTALATIDSHVQTVPAVGWPYGPPQRPEILSAKPNPIELMHAVRRRWPLAVGLGTAVGVLAAAIVWFLMPIRYEAYALLRVAEKTGGVLTKANEGADAFAIFKRTQVQYILSGPVLRGTVREPSIGRLSMVKEHDDDPVSWLNSEMILDYPDDAEILRVAIKGTNKDESIKIVDMVVKKYLSEVVERARNERLAQEGRLEKKYLDIVTEFTKQSEALHKLEQFNRSSTTDAAQIEKRLAEDNLLEALSFRNKIQRDIHQTEIDIAMLKAREAEPDTNLVPEAVVEMEIKRDPVIVSLNHQKAQLQAALARHMAVTIDASQSSTVRSLNGQINQIEQEIDEHSANMRPHVVEMLNERDLMDDSSLGRISVSMLEKQKAHLEEQLTAADAAIAEKTKAFDTLEKYNANVMAKREELAALKQIMTQLKAELDRTQVERLAQERITKVDDAQLASPRGDAIKKYVAVAFAGLLGFGIVVAGIAFGEFQSRKLNGTQQVNDGLGIKVIGELPSLGGRTWRRVKGGKGQAVLKALMAERIDGTRTALIHSTAVEPPRVIMVASAEPHEGKTTTSSQLAASLARAGRRTLLVDADIRNPGVHRVFEMPLEPGLSELLRGEAERDAVVHPTRTANLWLLPAGHCDLRSVQALSTSYLGSAIAALAVQFDYIVIDSGPILKVADSLLVGQHVDAAVLSVLKDVSKVPSVYEACERLRSVGITVMGAVVNGVNDDAARHGIELLMNEQN